MLAHQDNNLLRCTAHLLKHLLDRTVSSGFTFVHCARLALTQRLDVSTALVSRLRTHSDIDELVLLPRVNLSLTMLYTLLLRSWCCILPATLSIFVLHCSIQLRLHLSCVLLVPRTALYCFSSRGPLVALPARTPHVAAIRASQSFRSAVTNSSMRRDFSRE